MLEANDLVVAANGQVFVGPTTATLPTDETSTLDSEFIGLGYLTDAGVTRDGFIEVENYAKERVRVPKEALVDYFGYQLAVHHYNLKILATGMSMRGIKLTDLKKYYGLRGRTAKDVLPQFVVIMNNYKETLQIN
jgi:hypothetical protein